MTESPASPATHALQRSSDERVVDDDGPLDAPTLAALRHAHQRHGVAIAIGTAGPVGLGLLLLLLANTGVVAVPLAALVATCAMAVVAAPFALAMDRRAFVAECASLGLSSSRAKQLYAQHRREQRRSPWAADLTKTLPEHR
jgi:hypothetical protein